MVSVHSKNLQVFNASQFRESVSEESNTHIYFTFGKTVPWANDAAPSQANSSVTAENEVWQNMIGAKLLTGNDIRHVVPRYDWESGDIYHAYDHCTCSLNLFNNLNFYVVTTDWNVYKCLSNNRSSPSTTMPSSLATNDTIHTPDGYIWKYMYTVSPGEQLKYTTASYIPVKTLTTDDNSLQWDVQQAATPGGIDIIGVTNGGSNYTSNDTISITITGDGVGANAFAQINAVSNTVDTIFVDNPGLGYTYATATVTDSESGAGAVLRPIIGPAAGHGADPTLELGASLLLINPRLSSDENGIITTKSDYRQIALIKDPTFYGTTNVASNTVITQLLVLSLNGTSTDYSQDEVVYQGPDVNSYSFKGIVVEWDSANSLIKLSNTEGVPTSDVLAGVNSGASRFVTSINYPDLKPYSGRLLYIDNIEPIDRAEDQTEDFKIILKF